MANQYKLSFKLPQDTDWKDYPTNPMSRRRAERIRENFKDLYYKVKVRIIDINSNAELTNE